MDMQVTMLVRKTELYSELAIAAWQVYQLKTLAAR